MLISSHIPENHCLHPHSCSHGNRCHPHLLLQLAWGQTSLSCHSPAFTMCSGHTSPKQTFASVWEQWRYKVQPILAGQETLQVCDLSSWSSHLPCQNVLRTTLPPMTLSTQSSFPPSPFAAIRSATWSEGSLASPSPLHFILHAQLSQKTSWTSHPIWDLLGGFELTHSFWRNGKHCYSPPQDPLSHIIFQGNRLYLTFMQIRKRLKWAPKLPCECLLYLWCIISFSASSHSLQPGLHSLWLSCLSTLERTGEEQGREPELALCA